MNRVRQLLIAAVIVVQACSSGPRDTEPTTELDRAPAVTLDSAAAAFYASRADEYDTERRAIAASARRVTRRPAILRITTRNGRTVSFVDAIAEPNTHVRYLYSQFVPALDAHLVSEQYYEGSAYRLVNDSTGRVTGLADVPLVPSSGHRFAVASLDLDANYNPNRIEIWRVSGDSIVKEFGLDGGELWGPDSVVWVSPGSIRFIRVVRNVTDFTDFYFAHMLVRQDSSWIVQPPLP